MMAHSTTSQLYYSFTTNASADGASPSTFEVEGPYSPRNFGNPFSSAMLAIRAVDSSDRGQRFGDLVNAVAQLYKDVMDRAERFDLGARADLCRRDIHALAVAAREADEPAPLLACVILRVHHQSWIAFSPCCRVLRAGSFHPHAGPVAT
jgi:hypothetical protein